MLPPMGKGDDSLLPFPKPLSLSRAQQVLSSGAVTGAAACRLSLSHQAGFIRGEGRRCQAAGRHRATGFDAIDAAADLAPVWNSRGGEVGGGTCPGERMVARNLARSGGDPIPLSGDGVLIHPRIFHDQPMKGPLRQRAAAPAGLRGDRDRGRTFKEPSAGIGPLRMEPQKCRTIFPSPRTTPSTSPGP